MVDLKRDDKTGEMVSEKEVFEKNKKDTTVVKTGEQKKGQRLGIDLNNFVSKGFEILSHVYNNQLAILKQNDKILERLEKLEKSKGKKK